MGKVTEQFSPQRILLLQESLPTSLADHMKGLYDHRVRVDPCQMNKRSLAFTCLQIGEPDTEIPVVWQIRGHGDKNARWCNHATADASYADRRHVIRTYGQVRRDSSDGSR